MKQIEINGQLYLCVEVPEGAKDFRLVHSIKSPDLPHGIKRKGIQWTQLDDVDFIHVVDEWTYESSINKYQILSTVKNLLWAEKRDMTGKKQFATVNVHFDKIVKQHNLTNNTLLLKIITNE